MVLYTCSRCNNTFKRKSIFSYHINRKIKCDETLIFDPILIQNDPNAQKFDPILIQNDPISNGRKLDEKNEIQCKYCNKNFTLKGNLKRHIDKRCKKKEEYIEKDNEIEKLKVEVLELKKQIESKDKVNEMNVIITNNNTINTVNNISIVNFGQERISKLTEEEELKIIEGGANSIANHVSLVHFNKRLPEYMNVYNTNLRGNTCDVYYNGKWKKYKVKKIIDTLITNGVIDIQDLLIKYNNIHNFSVKCTREIVQDIENHNKKQIKEQNDRISTILYNEKDKPLQNKK